MIKNSCFIAIYSIALCSMASADIAQDKSLFSQLQSQNSQKCQLPTSQLCSDHLAQIEALSSQLNQQILASLISQAEILATDPETLAQLEILKNDDLTLQADVIKLLADKDANILIELATNIASSEPEILADLFTTMATQAPDVTIAALSQVAQTTPQLIPELVSQVVALAPQLTAKVIKQVAVDAPQVLASAIEQTLLTTPASMEQITSSLSETNLTAEIQAQITNTIDTLNPTVKIDFPPPASAA